MITQTKHTPSIPPSIADSKAWLTASDMPHLPQRLAAAWSGGADSTALLLALKQAGHDVQAWHVDHGWRDNSADEAAQLAEQAARWNIPFVSARLELANTSNREAEARRGRYACFQQWGRQYSISTLCLGQHLDDQAETVFMRLLQGAAAAGCRGMQRQRHMQELRIVRPLLHVRSQALRQALAQAGITWLEDPSNTDTGIWRNKIRHQIFPAMEKSGIAPHTLFLRWQQQAVIVAKQLDEAANAIMQKYCHQHSQTDDQVNSQKNIYLPWSTWESCSAVIRARLLQQLMAALMGAGVTPGRRHIELVEQWTKKSGCGGLDLSRCRLYRQAGRLHLQVA